MKIIEMISNNISNENLKYFSNFEQFVIDYKLQAENNFIKNVKHHYKMLKTTFKEYFKDIYSEYFWLKNRLILNLDNIG
jgi:hypothetical protein